MSGWVNDADEMHKHCVDAGLEVIFSPTDMPWNVRVRDVQRPERQDLRAELKQCATPSPPKLVFVQSDQISRDFALLETRGAVGGKTLGITPGG
jgi:hypothetical protein